MLLSTLGLGMTHVVLSSSLSCVVFVSITTGLLAISNGESRDDFTSAVEFLSVRLSGATLLNFLSGDRGLLGEDGWS